MKNYSLITHDGEETIKDVLTLKEIESFLQGTDIEHIGNIYSNADSIRLNLPRNVKFPNFLGNIIIENR